ncbi:MAG: hypothetical protein JWO91_119 [Acidobacteriaceae bacterium]|nr:hypothetical protein [Acidobacteriaceae bacterium]
MELATLEKTELAWVPTSLTVPITNTRMRANMTAYSAMSCPVSSIQNGVMSEAMGRGITPY